MVCIYRHFFDLLSFTSNICRYPFLTFISFKLKQSQARRSLVLRKDKGMLAYPQCSRGNIPLSDAAIDRVFKFYCEDGISRVSSNSKDTMEINGQAVAVRFMEMTVLDAYRIFNERFPGAVARSTFYALRPREVKTATPHDTCICIIHENIGFIIESSCLLHSHSINRIFHYRLGTIITKICRHSLLFIQ